MADHRYVPDPAISLAYGPPLAEEEGLGELTLPGFLREVTDRFAAREALVQQHEDAAPARWSYADLWDRSVAVAKALAASGLAKGERVGVLMTNRAEFLSAVFGTALAGGVAAPIGTFSTADELEHLLGASACSILLIERRVLKKDFAEMLCAIDPAIEAGTPGAFASARFPFLRRIAAVGGEGGIGAVEDWSAFLEHGDAVPAARIEARAATVKPSDPAVLFFSSGTTSRPKGILSAHRGVAIQLWRMARQQALADGVRSWTANGFFWSGNFAMVVGGTLARGGSLILQSIFHAEEALNLMEREKASFLFAWPHQWEQLMGAPNWETADLSPMVHVDAHSPLSAHPSIKTDWLQPGHAYGNTETFTLSTGYPANTTREEAGDSHGLPFPGNVIKIVDPMTGETVPLGERGEIAVKGPTLMLGYLGVPIDETLDATGFFRTGDGGYLDREGRLFWEGRLGDIIKTGGANVSPVEVDEIVIACPGVKLSQTVGVPHETLGELVVTCIVPHEGEAPDEATVRAYAKTRLASYKVPRRVLVLAEDDMRLTGSAKVKAADLRELAAKRLETCDAVL